MSVLLVVWAVSSSGLIALAQSQSAELPGGNGFRITPVRREYTIEPGQSQTLTITVDNSADTKVTARPVVNNFLPSEDESGAPRLILDERVLPPTNDFKRLVQPLEDFVVPAGGSKNIDVIISVPSDARAGGYYGAIRFVPLLPGLDDDENVALTASVGTIILVQVPGDLKQQLDLVQIGAVENGSFKGFFIGGKVDIGTRLRNSGDIHIQPFGRIQVKNMFGKVVHEYEFNNKEQRDNILPDSTRKFVDEIPQQKWFGRYTISANLGFGSSSESISGRTTFWYFSPVVFYILLILIVVIVATTYWFIRRYRKAHRPHKR